LIVNKTGYKWLLDAGVIDSQRLGALKVEHFIDGAEFRGAKDYTIGTMKYAGWGLGYEHIKGVSSRGQKIGPNTYLQDRFWSWDYLASRGHDGSIIVERYEKTLARTYDKGEITESGRVIPLVLEEQMI
jgi:hypothetical protein